VRACWRPAEPGRRGAGRGSDGRLNADNSHGGMLFTESNFTIVDALREVAAEVGRPMAQVALAWVVQRPACPRCWSAPAGRSSWCRSTPRSTWNSPSRSSIGSMQPARLRFSILNLSSNYHVSASSATSGSSLGDELVAVGDAASGKSDPVVGRSGLTRARPTA